MKAIKATLTTSQPVISEEEFQTMFFKIDELYTVHTRFLSALRQKVSQIGDILVGETFRELAGHINLYGAFLHNYGRAIDTVKKCGSNNQQFKEIVSNIILNSQNEQSLTLEDLLHKPVARVQKNALVLQVSWLALASWMIWHMNRLSFPSRIYLTKRHKPIPTICRWSNLRRWYATSCPNSILFQPKTWFP